jgi:hypothetical protein
LWRLPESEKDGTYTLRIEVKPDDQEPSRGLIIVTDEGDEICPVADAKDGEFRPSWHGSRVT